MRAQPEPLVNRLEFLDRRQPRGYLRPLPHARSSRDRADWTDASPPVDADRLQALEYLLSLDAADVHATLQRAVDALARALRADTVDVFLHDPELSQLRAIATSNTEVSRRQRALGLDRLRLDSGRGRASVVFQTRFAYLSHGVDRDPAELPEMYSELHLRAAVFAPVDIAGRRGVIVARAVDVGQFSCADLAFLEAVASWMGLVGTSMRRADARFDGEEPGAYQQHHDVRSLTPRQREIARLIARGCSNATIARVLVITPGTVANHVAQILNRLDVHNRSQVAVMVAQAARPTLL